MAQITGTYVYKPSTEFNIGFGSGSYTGSTAGAKVEIHQLYNACIRTYGRTDSDWQYRGLIIDNGGTAANAKMIVVRNEVDTSTDETFTVYSDGDAANDNNSWSALSDIRAKENIIEIYSGSQQRNYQDDLMKLKVWKYSLKKQSSEVPTQLGLLADEVEDIFPGLVVTATGTTKLMSGSTYIDDPKTLKYSVLNVMLLKGYQELVEEVKTLKAQISSSNDFCHIKINYYWNLIFIL